MTYREHSERLQNLGPNDTSWVGGLLAIRTITDDAPSCSYYWLDENQHYELNDAVEELHLLSGQDDAIEVWGYLYIVDPEMPDGVKVRQ